MSKKAEEVKKYACGRSKTKAILYEIPSFHSAVVRNKLHSMPNSLSADGSHTSESKKVLVYNLIL